MISTSLPYRQLTNEARWLKGSVDVAHRKPGDEEESLIIGLVNNMPRAASDVTEKQFRELLTLGAGETPIQMRLFSLPGVAGSEGRLSDLNSRYSDINEISSCALDGLIVTGTEPIASDLRAEPYWGPLAELIDWADRNAISTIFSCLAAHAAVLHCDGIERRTLSEKCVGVFDHVVVASHFLTNNLPTNVEVPHSRWNHVDEEPLIRSGYQVLTVSADAGVDLFVKRRNSLCIYFQGHPEFDADSLLREYKRDIRRFLNGGRATCPWPPRRYFDHQTEMELNALTPSVSHGSAEAVIARVTEQVAAVPPPWRQTGATIMRNWINYLRKQNR